MGFRLRDYRFESPDLNVIFKGELLQTAVGGSSSDNLRGYSMKDAERMLSYGYSQQQNQPHQQQQNSYGFQQQQPSAYGYGMTSQNVYGMQQQQQQQQGYGKNLQLILTQTEQLFFTVCFCMSPLHSDSVKVGLNK